MNLVSYNPVNYEIPYNDVISDARTSPYLFDPYSDESLGITRSSDDPMKSYIENLQKNIYKPAVETPVETPGDKRQYAKQWLIQNEKLTNEQASALVGVLYAESKLDPSIHEYGKESNPYAGQGIAQWTGRARQQHVKDLYKQIYGKSKEIKQMTLDEQLRVMIAEFKERTGNWERFKKSTNLDKATDIVWRGYENGGNYALASHQQMEQIYKRNKSKQWKDRLRFAKEIYTL